MTRPLVSIGLPVYNAEKTLPRALESLLSQEMGDFEVIVSDNASTDRTREIVEEMASSDSRVKFYRNEKNLGAWFNFDRTFALAKGKFFKWASDDDWFSPSILGKAVDVLDSNPEVSLCTWLERMVDVEGVERRRYTFEQRWAVESEDPGERFLQFLHAKKRGSKGDPIYGLMRAETARQTRLLEAGLWIPNFIMMGELAVLGPWVTIPEVLVDRGYPSGPARWGDELSVRNVIRHFDPPNGEQLWPHWRFMAQHFSIVHKFKKFKVPTVERPKLYFEIGMHFAKLWRGLAYDIGEAGRALMGCKI